MLALVVVPERGRRVVVVVVVTMFRRLILFVLFIPFYDVKAPLPPSPWLENTLSKTT